MKFPMKVEQGGDWPQEACHDDVLLNSEDCHDCETDADVGSLVGGLERTSCGIVAAEVSSGLRRYRWPKWRRPSQGCGKF